MLDHVPDQLHIVLSTRIDPPWPPARLRARSQLTELRAADLRFTPNEAAAFLNRVMDLNPAAEDVEMMLHVSGQVSRANDIAAPDQSNAGPIIRWKLGW